jgi:NNP family nitrate/nitrite transporter-like MFS transporter
MGFFGAGTMGAALNMFVAPRLIEAYGWEMVPKVYAVVLVATAAIVLAGQHARPRRRRHAQPDARAALAVLKDWRVWKLCQYYSLTFGGFTALSLWMTEYYVQEYGASVKTAGLLAIAFALPAGVLRAAGGCSPTASVRTASRGGCCGPRGSRCSDLVSTNDYCR